MSKKIAPGSDDAGREVLTERTTEGHLVAPASSDFKIADAAVGENRLPVLAAEIRKAHADVQEAARKAAQRAIECGHLLIEAKELVAHGEWLPWLREHCAIPARTATLYMKIAKSGLDIGNVADLGLQGAAEAIVFHIDYWSDLSAAELVEWRVFALFLARKCGFHIDGAIQHSEWLRRGDIQTPDDWVFGPDGQRFRQQWYGSDLPQETLDSWRDFLAANRGRTAADIEAEFERVYAEQGPPRDPPLTKRQRHLLRADRKYMARLRKALGRRT